MVITLILAMLVQHFEEISAIGMYSTYNAVNFLTNIHKRYLAARQVGRGMGCIL